MREWIEAAQESEDAGQRELTIHDLRAMMGNLRRRQEARRTECALSGHAWGTWLVLREGRAGRKCERCSHVQMLDW